MYCYVRIKMNLVNPVSRICFGFHSFILFLNFLGFFDPQEVYFSPYFIKQEFEIKRVFLPLLFSGTIQALQFLFAFTQYKISSAIESEYFYITPASFVILKIYAHVGVIISAFIEPEPYLFGRNLMFYIYLASKLFSNEFLGFNVIFDKHIPLTYFSILHLIFCFLFCPNERNVAKLFIYFWAHLYFFIKYMAPSCGVMHILRAPQKLESFLLKIL